LVNTSEILHLVFVAETDDIPVMDAVRISDAGMSCSHSDDDDHRTWKVFESVGSNWGEDEGCAVVCVQEGVARPQ